MNLHIVNDTVLGSGIHALRTNRVCDDRTTFVRISESTIERDQPVSIDQYWYPRTTRRTSIVTGCNTSTVKN